jgi:hypothetical protein
MDQVAANPSPCQSTISPHIAVAKRLRFRKLRPVNKAEPYRLVQLVNGVFSVRAHAEDETFHPVIGPAAEAEALYVRQLRLAERMAAQREEFVIWDVGLGAAANALAALRAGQTAPCPVRMISFDHTLEPLAFALRHTEALGYFEGYTESLATLVREGRVHFRDGSHEVAWETQVADFPTLLASPAAAKLPPPHAILFDAFSPAKNPAMWTLPLFTQLFARLSPARPCAMPTYSRSTMLRVTLLLAGFYVGAGHATGEKEETTIAANSLVMLNEPLDRRWLARAHRSTSAEPLREPVYHRAKLSAETYERLLAHPQFQC